MICNVNMIYLVGKILTTFVYFIILFLLQIYVTQILKFLIMTAGKMMMKMMVMRIRRVNRKQTPSRDEEERHLHRNSCLNWRGSFMLRSI
jgi:hypothetical protein